MQHDTSAFEALAAVAFALGAVVCWAGMTTGRMLARWSRRWTR